MAKHIAPPVSLTPDELRAACKRLKLSQRMLGEALGLSTRCVEEWVSARRPIPPWLTLAMEALLYPASHEQIGYQASTMIDLMTGPWEATPYYRGAKDMKANG